jgi:hypothetical protein
LDIEGAPVDEFGFDVGTEAVCDCDLPPVCG